MNLGGNSLRLNCCEKGLIMFTCLFVCFSSLSTVEPIDVLRQVRLNPRATILQMYPQDFKRLFEAIERSEDTIFKWIYDEGLEDIQV